MGRPLRQASSLPFALPFTFGRCEASYRIVSCLTRWIASVLLFGWAVVPAQASFSSLYVFGDGVSTTTNNMSGGSLYWGKRFTNGRTWVEVLAQRQGLTNNTLTNVDWSYSSNNWSYFGHYSSNLVQNVNAFPAPTNAATSLFVIWVCDADFVYFITHYGPTTPGDTNIQVWTNAISLSLSNHFRVVTNLYAKGARTLVMPNAVDLTKVPSYVSISSTNEKAFIRQMVIYFNTNFASLLNQVSGALPDLTVYSPDFFSLFDNVVAYPTNYGLIKPDKYVLGDDPALKDYSLNGPGTNYVFWDYQDPTAKTAEIMADVAQQLISPPTLSRLAPLNGSNRLDVVNYPIGLGGFVDGRTNPAYGNWSLALTNFNSTNAVQSIFVPAPGPPAFYRLRFPFAWTWP
jgi:phospholipase/lecithinase/hemolysin